MACAVIEPAYSRFSDGRLHHLSYQAVEASLGVEPSSTALQAVA